MKILKKGLIIKLFNICLALCALCELLIIQYFNFFEAKEHLGIDSSWEYLKLAVISKEGGYFPKELLSETTSPGTGKIFLLMAPINRLINDIWTSYAIGNFLISLVIVFVLWKLLARLNFNTTIRLIIVNLFICPYLSNGFEIDNDLGYFSCTNGVPGYENVLILLLLLTLLVLTYDNQQLKEKIVIAITLALYIYTGVSAGISLLIFCGTPVFLYIPLKVFLKNDYKELKSWRAIFLYSINVAIIVGVFIGKTVGLSYGESSINWITAPEFFENIQHEFLGFMMLVGAVPKTGAFRSPTSIMGISYVFGLIIFAIILISICHTSIQYFKESRWNDEASDITLFGISMIVITFIQFALLDTSVGQDIFETRYLINALICGFIFVGYFINSLDDRLVFKKFGLLLLALSIVEMNLFSDYVLGITDNRSYMVNEVQEIVNGTDAGLVYFWGNEQELVPTYEIIRVYDLNRIYKGICYGNQLMTYGQYKYYDDSTLYSGPTAIVVSEAHPAEAIDILKKYEYIDKVDGMEIYYSKENYIDLRKITTIFK